MELGELEFTQDELTGLYVENACCGEKLLASGAGMLSVDLNRILREKLAKAPEVFGVCSNGLPSKYAVGSPEGIPWATHRARLVCIEELK